MTEFDKKFQKAQPDLVQSVLDAQEKKNLERVDVLISNAIKQLKMSRFKPDQATCLSLTYLARISPKTFSQSNVIKDLLKSLVRRDNGPPSIKGKNDIILPVLAANILLACCDSSEIREMILQRILQWNSPSPSELVQHLMATLCMRCQSDKQTIQSLIDMHQDWIQYFEESFEPQELVPADLCSELRKLIHFATSKGPLSLLEYLKFLVKHDADIEGLGETISQLLITKPIWFRHASSDSRYGELYHMCIKIYVKLFKHLEELPSESVISTCQDAQDGVDPKQKIRKPDLVGTSVTDSSTSNNGDNPTVIVKFENIDDKQDVKNGIKNELKDENMTLNVKSETMVTQPIKIDPTKSDSECSELKPTPSFLYVKDANCSKVIKMSSSIIEGMLLLLARSFYSIYDDYKKDLFDCWLIDDRKIRDKKMADVYEDFALTKIYKFSDDVRRQLIQSNSWYLNECVLRNASPAQLIKSLHQFGMARSATEMILKKLEKVEDIELLKSEIPDHSHFSQLLEYYYHTGFSSAKKLNKRLYPTLN